MKFDEALRNFKNEIAKEYGTFDALIEIALAPDVFRLLFHSGICG